MTGKLYLEQFRESVLKNADKIAIRDSNGKEVSYKELMGAAEKAAGAIQARGIKPQSAVIILLGRNSDYVASYLGVLMAGCIAVPLTTASPEERIREISEDCQAAYIVRDYEEFMGVAASASFRPAHISGSDTAIILYTSGSTGKPKGVVHDHNSLTAAAERSFELMAGFESIRYASTQPFQFAPFTSDLFSVFLQGGSCFIVDSETRLDVKKLLYFYKENKIDMSFIHPQMLKIMRTLVDDRDFPVKRVLVGAERVINMYSPYFEIWNVYGMSETFSGISYFKIDKEYENVPVGKAYKNNEITIENEEVCVKSYYARRYLNREEESRKTFFPCQDGQVLIHTGDRGYFDENGNLVITGRMDFMIKINGNRVEPEEVENRLLMIPEIKEAVVVGISQKGRNMLAAYFTVREKKQLTRQQILDHLKTTLPDYMIPSHLTCLEKMPRNLNGKIDRSKLPSLNQNEPALIPAKSAKEIQARQIWEELLDLKAGEIGINSDFFELGGDSIRSIMLSVQYEKTFGVSLTPTEIFKNRTITSQLQLINAGKKVSDIFVYNDEPGLARVYFVHTGHTGGEAYLNLSKLLRSCCSMRCFEPNNIFHQDKLIKGVKNLAAKYIELLKADQKEGPYILGGWSYGGMVAYEMACQLRKAGEEVLHLFLLDPDFMTSEREKELYTKVFTADNFDDYLKKDPLFERFRQMGLLDKVEKNSKIVLDDMVNFVPENYDGRVTFYKAQKFDVNENSPETGKELFSIIKGKKANGFEDKIKNLKIINIDTEHDNFMKGYALYKIALNMEMTISNLKK